MRYFIETSYKGTAYSGFQVQQNAVTIQSQVQKALLIFFKQAFSLTGASRTDAGVHALQNFFHFDTEQPLEKVKSIQGAEFGYKEYVYHLNAILPPDIVIKRIFPVGDNEHCRFDAISREYKYFIYKNKDPFLEDRSYYFPYNVDIGKLKDAAKKILLNTDFTAFSKKNSQVNNFNCSIQKSEWIEDKDNLIYRVESNRFLRGMVKGLVGTMLRVGTGKITLDDFNNIIKNRDCSNVDFSVPPYGLFLIKVTYDIF